jgi:hypothetical protein
MSEKDEIPNAIPIDEVSEPEFRASAQEIFRVLAEREGVSDDAILIAAMLQLVAATTSRQTEVLEFIIGSSDIASVLSSLPSTIN